MMTPTLFQLAVDGWRILDRYPDSRERARHLVRFIVDRMNAASAEIRFVEPFGGYRWQERAARFGVDGHPAAASWSREFPDDLGSWIVDGLPSVGNGDSGPRELLNLLADQWIRLARLDHDDHRPGRLRTRRVRPVPGWVAVSRWAREMTVRLPILGRSDRPLLLAGENGSGRRHLAGIIRSFGPDPVSPGNEDLPEWSFETISERPDPPRGVPAIVAVTLPKGPLDRIRRAWSVRTGGAGRILVVPPLRERREDIPLLAGTFLREATEACGFPAPELSGTALDALTAYRWPGNVGELKAAMFEAVGRTEDGRIGAAELSPAIRGALKRPAAPSFPERLVALEYEVLREELDRQRGNMTRTARALGLTPRQVSWRVRKYGIDPREFKKTPPPGVSRP